MKWKIVFSNKYLGYDFFVVYFKQYKFYTRIIDKPV
jgi:hypothetical protein